MIIDVLENLKYIKCIGNKTVYGVKDKNGVLKEVPCNYSVVSKMIKGKPGGEHIFYKNSFNVFVEKVKIKPLVIPENLADDINYICMDSRGSWKCFKLKPHIRIRTGGWKTKKAVQGFPKDLSNILHLEWPYEAWQTSLHYKDIDGVWHPYVPYDKM